MRSHRRCRPSPRKRVKPLPAMSKTTRESACYRQPSSCSSDCEDSDLLQLIALVGSSASGVTDAIAAPKFRIRPAGHQPDGSYESTSSHSRIRRSKPRDIEVHEYACPRPGHADAAVEEILGAGSASSPSIRCAPRCSKFASVSPFITSSACSMVASLLRSVYTWSRIGGPSARVSGLDLNRHSRRKRPVPASDRAGSATRR